MFRRTVAIVSLLGLLALEPGLLSLCALAANLPGECATPAANAACDQMNALQPEAQLSAQARAECCQLSAAPIPEAQGKVSTPSPELSNDAVVFFPFPSPRGAQRESSAMPADTSPPDLLPLLCTFLI